MIVKGGLEIRDLETWRRHAGPKRQLQWKDGRSAKEAARSWLGALPSIPPSISDALQSHPDFSTLTEWEAEPEAHVRFDRFPGEPSNVDILVRGSDAYGPIVIAVEAKADETFGATLGQTLKAAKARLAKNVRSKGVERVCRLGDVLFDMPLTGLSSLSEIRYQLMTVSAAALAEAKRHNASRSVVMIQEFVTSETDDRKHRSNAEDLDRFIRHIAGEDVADPSGSLVGPLRIYGPPEVRDSIGLYIGKVSVNLR